MGAIARLLALSVWFWSLDLQLPSLQVHPGDSPTLLPMDKEQAVQRLRKSLTYPTITGSPGFTAFHSFLEQSFPLVHEHLEKTVLQNHSLVYYWPGSDPRLKPALFLAHQDVVPVTAEANWTFPPFSGKVSKGFIYGRGALDMKSVLMAQLDVIESLLKAKKTLSRSIYLFSGHDEETGGHSGARWAAQWFKKKQIEFEFVLDEGLMIVNEIIPGYHQEFAIIGMAEKGMANYVVTATAQGGHASMPTQDNSIVHLAKALSRLKKCDHAPYLSNGIINHMLDTLSPELHPYVGWALLNLKYLEWILGPLVRRIPWLNSLVRTTFAVTMIQGGVAHNVLPNTAQANINVRIHPEDSVGSILARLQKCLGNPHVSVSLDREKGYHEPSKTTSTRSDPYLALSRTIRQTFDHIPVIPGLMIASTDSIHFQSISHHIFRFNPIKINPKADLKRIHGVDERIHVHQYGNAKI